MGQTAKPSSGQAQGHRNERRKQLVDAIEDAAKKTAFAIIDLSTASSAVGVAMSRADLVVIPTKGSDPDAAEAVKAIAFIRFRRRSTGERFHMRCCSQTCPAIRPRTDRGTETELLDQGIPMFGTQLHERDPYRAIFAFGGTLAPDKAGEGSMPPLPTSKPSRTIIVA